MIIPPKKRVFTRFFGLWGCPPEDLVGHDCELKEFRVEGARDAVIVGQFEGGGIISCRKEDNTYLHTLNTEEGLERKLAQLGISL